MAVTQTTADKGGISPIATADATASTYYGIKWGSIILYQGTGSPNAVITAPIGSMYVELGAGKLYINTDAGTTWGVVGGQS
jgi:hypothetical protein